MIGPLTALGFSLMVVAAAAPSEGSEVSAALDSLPPDTPAVTLQTLEDLHAQVRSAELKAALALAAARQLEQQQGPGPGLDRLRSVQGPGPLATLVTDERLRLALAAGRDKHALAILKARLGSATRRKRPAKVQQLVDLGLASPRPRFVARVRAVLDASQDAAWIDLLGLHELGLRQPGKASMKKAVELLPAMKGSGLVQRYDALLAELGITPEVLDALPRSELMRYAGRLVDAGLAERCLELLEQRPPGRDRTLLRLRALSRLRRYPAALVEADSLLAEPAQQGRGEAMLERARVLSRLGRGEEAKTAYRAFLGQNGAGPEADRAAFFAAWIDHEAGRARSAAQGFQRYLDQRGRARMAPLVRWLLALNLYRSGDLEPALVALKNAEDKPASTEVQTAARYFRARCLAELGRDIEAGTLLDAMIAGPLRPASKAPYYRAMARAARAQLDQAARRAPRCSAGIRAPGVATHALRAPTLPVAAATPEGDRACAVALRRAVTGLRPYISAGDARAAEALASVGLCALAPRLLGQVPLPSQEPARRAYLETLLAARDETRTLRLAARFYSKQLALPPDAASRWQWELAYPRPAVLAGISHPVVPTALILGIARQESHFMPRAVSPVGALGMMQIMPATGRRLGALAELPGARENLLEPPQNVRLASQYLELLSLEFDGTLPLMAASYNAGPHNVQRWHGRLHDLPLDTFVESIPFRETRGYVKKVMSATTIYGWLDDAANPEFWAREPCPPAQAAYLVEF